MNKITRDEKNIYTLTTDKGTFVLNTWYEKKCDKTHFLVPDEAGTGRKYIRKDIVDNALKTSTEYTFDDKTTGPRTLSTWRSRLTEAEAKELEQAEATIERLKKLGESRKPESEVDKLKAQIEELQKLLASQKPAKK